MNSPRGSIGTPAHLNRDGSISPQPLDSPSLSSKVEPHTHTHNTQQASNEHRVASFSKLPSKVLLRILWLADANTFASLCILNRRCRAEAQKVELYAYHLSRCPSYALSNAVISGPFRRNDLSRLKAKFAAEVRRNLFAAYLRPRRTFVNLISITASSSAAFPAGEAFRFEFSPNARTVLALSSSRIYVLDASVDPPAVKRHLKTLRRPLSASVTDDGSLLAVLSSKHQVNIYGLTPRGVQHLQVIVLDNPPKLIAIAHEGTVLAASYEAGIEVFSLAANALTTDRRAVRSEAVDALTFSGDGSMLIGSSLGLDDPNAVVISAPFYTENDPDLSPREIHSRMWTTQILFPQISSVCSHVALLQGHIEGDAYWLFAFDHSLMSYRAVRTDDTRAGVAYFLSPPGADRFETLTPTIPPSASACGTLAVAAFEGAGLWLYGVPERLDISPDMGAVIERQNERRLRNGLPLTSATGHTEPLLAYSPSNSASDYPIEDDSLASKVDWRQSLFVKCRNINGLDGQTAARWVEHVDSATMQTSKRLIVVAPGGVSLDGDGLGEENMPVDGSRMCILDFDYVPSVPADRVLTIEVGDGEPELLSEHTGSLATEVAMERRRTIRAIPNTESSRMPLGRSITSISPPSTSFFEDGFRRGSVSTPSSPVEQPRGQQLSASSSLHRSVTASGFRHARYPPRPPLGSAQYMNQNQIMPQRLNQYGRPLSQDSWESPPPPYSGHNSVSQPRDTSHRGMLPISEQASSAVQQPTGRFAAQTGFTEFRPYRSIVAERRSATLDTIMTSHAVPTGAAITQYEELMMAARSRGPSEASLDTVAEPVLNVQSSPSARYNNRASFSNKPNVEANSPVRPMTHHGTVPQGWHIGGRNTTMPISPENPSIPNGPMAGSAMISPLTPLASSKSNVAGSSSQGRPNQPIPPVPEIPRSLLPGTSVNQPEHRPTSQASIRQHDRSKVYSNLPPSEQMANLNGRMVEAELQRPLAVKNTNFVHRKPVGSVQPSSSGPWGAAAVLGSHTLNPVRNIPYGFSRSRSSSSGSQALNQASVSTPDLSAPRSQYNRMENLDGVNNTVGFREISAARRSRTYSMNRTNTATNVEPSAYHETSRLGPGPAIGKYGKKSKRPREETIKRGMRCIVM